MHTLAHTDWMFPYGNNEVYKGAVTDGGSAAFSSLWRGCKQTNDGSTHDPPTNTHTHTCTHTHTHSTCTMASLASCICFYLVACLLEMLLRGIWTFSHPLPAYMCGWSVCLHASARLTLSVWSLDWANTMKNDVRESRWCLRKKKKTRQRGTRLTGGKEVISELFSHCGRAEGGWGYKSQLVVELADALCNSYSVLCNLFR